MGNALSAVKAHPASLGVAIGVPLGLGMVVASGSAKAIKNWLPKLKKPQWQPPSWVFGPVWSTLYTLMGIASWMVWREEGFKGKGAVALSIYGAQLLFNLAWNPLAFQAKRLDLSLADSVLLTGTGVATAVAFQRIKPEAGQLMYPLVAWAAFATALNAWLLNNNPDADKIVTEEEVEEQTRKTVEASASGTGVYKLE